MGIGGDVHRHNQVSVGDLDAGVRLIVSLRNDMAALLAKASSSGGLTVKLLLDTLAIVTDFEIWLVKKFASPVRVLRSLDPWHSR